ncbi:MAG: PEP-CTERM sorting domain-containing protein [Bdellovibrionales bacterium]|nr:PEP-CTERM sorting domain-containing protein [Bdellovibrionales bacterium]
MFGIQKKIGLLALAIGVVLPTASASATTYTYTESNWVNGVNYQDTGGIFNFLEMTYNDVNHVFTFEFETETRDPNGADPRRTEGFTLAVNNGPIPRGADGLALLYFDASGADPVLTAYAYNGQNNQSSHQVGPNGGAATVLLSANQGPNATGGISFSESGNTQTFSFSLDTDLLANALLVNNGLHFGPSEIGIWLHTFAGVNSAYSNGALSSFRSIDGKGFTDLSHQAIPEPGTMLLLGAALGGAALRRRQQAE